jgi:hypothetical protein
LDTSFLGGSDAFVAKFSSTGSLVWSTFLGGGSAEWGYDITTDGQGGVYVTGNTYSTDFPTPGGWDTSQNGSCDAFVAKFNSSGSLVWSTFVGGANYEEGRGVTTDGQGGVYVTGWTHSTDFPAVAGWDTSYNGNDDAFVAKFSSTGPLVWSTFLGGGSDDGARGITTDGQGGVYVTGYTWSTDFPTPGGWDTSYNGDQDAFVAKFTEVWRLSVRSTPVTGVSIAGTPAGKTNYSSNRQAATAVNLAAPASVSRPGRYYAFVRWLRDGVAQRAGLRTLKFTITKPTTATAVFRELKYIKIKGPTTVNEGSTASYKCIAYFSSGAPLDVTAKAAWTESSVYISFLRPGLLRTYSVPANRTCRIRASYKGKSCYLDITVRNIR